MSTVCLKCGVATAVGEEMGDMGLPSLDETPRGRGRHRLSARLSSGGDADSDETFGHLCSGLEAIGLCTHPVETYRAFLREHSGKGHRLYLWNEHEDLPRASEESPPHFVPYKRPRRLPGFVWARVRFTCGKCGEQYESASAEWVRPFDARALSAEDVQTFWRRTVKPSEENIRDAWPFQIVLFDELDDWLTIHARHRLGIELVREDAAVGDGSRRQRAQSKSAHEASLPIPEPWRPAPVPPEEDERLLGSVSDEALLPLAGLHHRDAAVRTSAAKALGLRAEPGTVGYLAPLLDDPSEDVRLAVVAAIGAVADARCVRPFGYALLDECGQVRKIARDALARVGVTEDEALRRAREARGRADLKASSKASMQGAQGRLERVLRDAVHPDHSHRSAAAAQLRRLRGPRVVEMVVALLADYSDDVVATVAETAGALRARDAVEALVAAARAARERPRSSTLRALGVIGDARAVPVLESALDDKEHGVRDCAVEALAQVEGAAASVALVSALRAREEDVRWRAAQLLGKRKDTAAVPALVAALVDGGGSVPESAAQALVAIGDRAGLDAVVAAAVQGNAPVAGAAHAFLLSEGDPRCEDALIEALDKGCWNRARLATLYALSGNARLADAGKAALRGRKPERNVKPITWGSGRRR